MITRNLKISLALGLIKLEYTSEKANRPYGR